LAGGDLEAGRGLAAAMPPEAHATPLDDTGSVRLPEPERLLRAFLDAVADTLPRSPAAPLVTGTPGYAVPEPQHLPGLRDWAADVAAGHDAGVRLSLRIEVRRPAGAAGRHDAGTWAREGLGLARSEEHTSELQSREQLVCRLLL